jgi:hypothetical protein
MSAKAATREKGEMLVEEWVSGIASAVVEEFKTKPLVAEGKLGSRSKKRR